jgi:hypothetical protein
MGNDLEEKKVYALRVTFQYKGTNIRKIGQQRVEMIALPSHPTEGYEGQVGFWVELRDQNDKTVYRRVIRNPIHVHREVFAAEEELTRRPIIKTARGTFEIVVPDIPEAPNLVLFGTPQPLPTPLRSPHIEAARPPIPRVGTEPAREIARFNLKEDTK